MTNINYDYIDSYITSIIPENTGKLRELEDYAKENKVPVVTKDVEQFLKTIIAIKKPKNILEVGAAVGYSSILMAGITCEDTRITTIERFDLMYEAAEKNIRDFSYQDKINLIYGDANEVLETLEGPYDFVFLDAAKGQYKNFFEKIESKLSPNALIVSDNILFKGMVANDDLVIRRKKTIVKRLREYLDYLMNIDGYKTSIIPLGDGVALTYKEGE